MVTGGIDDNRAADAFQQRSANRGQSVVPGSQERVRLFGVWGTQHRGIPIPVPHRYNGDRAWRARFRNTNGTERTGYMLQGCGNDVTISGSWYIPMAGARVEEGWGDEAPALVQPTAPVVVPTTEPVVTAPATTSIETDSLQDGVVKIEIRKGTFGNPAMVRMIGVDEKADHTIELQPGVITVRYTPAEDLTHSAIPSREVISRPADTNLPAFFV